MAKHYIRIDENNNIIKGFSDDFEQSIEGDIIIRENAERQFYIEHTEFGTIIPNPDLLNENGCYLYKWENDKITEKSQTEIKNTGEYIEYRLKEIRNIRNVMLDRCDIENCNAERWETYVEDQKQKIRAYKQQLRDLPDQNFDDIDNIEYPVLEL